MKKKFSTYKWFEACTETPSFIEENLDTVDKAADYFPWVLTCEGREIYRDEEGDYWAGIFNVCPEWCVDAVDYKEYIRNEESKSETNI